MVRFGGAAGLSPRVENQVGSPAKEAPIPVLIAQTCFPSPLRLRVHTGWRASDAGASVDGKGGRKESIRRAGEGMGLFLRTDRGTHRLGKYGEIVLQRHETRIN